MIKCSSSLLSAIRLFFCQSRQSRWLLAIDNASISGQKICIDTPHAHMSFSRLLTRKFWTEMHIDIIANRLIPGNAAEGPTAHNLHSFATKPLFGLSCVLRQRLHRERWQKATSPLNIYQRKQPRGLRSIHKFDFFNSLIIFSFLSFLLSKFI